MLSPSKGLTRAAVRILIDGRQHQAEATTWARNRLFRADPKEVLELIDGFTQHEVYVAANPLVQGQIQ